MKAHLLSAQSPSQPSSPRVRRLRLIGEIGATILGALLGVALAFAAAPHRDGTHQPARPLRSSAPS